MTYLDAAARFSRAVAPLASVARPFLLLFMLVLIVDAVLAGLDIAYRYGELTQADLPAAFCISEEGSIAELLEYALSGMTTMGMAIMFLETGAPAFALSMAAFAWITCDNAFELHEQAGAILSPYFGFLNGAPVQAQDAGEIGFYLAVGTPFAALTILCLRRGSFSANLPGLAVAAFVPVAAIFGIGVDLAHSMLRANSPIAGEVAGFVEDFGELLAICGAWALAMGIRIRASVQG